MSSTVVWMLLLLMALDAHAAAMRYSDCSSDDKSTMKPTMAPSTFSSAFGEENQQNSLTASEMNTKSSSSSSVGPFLYGLMAVVIVGCVGLASFLIYRRKQAQRRAAEARVRQGNVKILTPPSTSRATYVLNDEQA